MEASDVVKLYNDLQTNNIDIWIDGGWCVDALLGRQTRVHPDLDIAIDRKDISKLKDLLITWGYSELTTKDSTEWNFVMKDTWNKKVDVHVFEFDANGNNIYGVKYSADSLKGKGVINGQTVDCISPEWMFKFKTAYAPSKKDLQDVRALSNKFGFDLPKSYQ